MSYKVKLEAFEGPLDLLLHLINRLEIDIYDIPMAELTQQYIEHLQTMRVLQLDELSEYLVLAATLIEIKSKMLLPVHEGEEFDDDMEFDMEDDPRDELVARLIEYRKYKEAAINLKESADERSDYFTRTPGDLSVFGEVIISEMEDSLSVFDLIGAFQKMLDRKRLKAPLTASIMKTERSVGEKMNEIMATLERSSGVCDFHSLFEEGDRSDLVLTFLSLLELMKRRNILVEQHGNFDELTVSFRREGE
ncbi:segregation/condensation protein A [Sporosarcina limicola]|uniref:Segregation and condensation protein A n=1 Tax=Sporosarcina limicola TaxID=34101 RepID=A0A927MHV9_9BACL|nr:segregation/condensation protein A [Sporosarcina limicola]MBE1554076.1 segregation and condensation protein A [Sporosarcina limicola]